MTRRRDAFTCDPNPSYYHPTNVCIHTTTQPFVLGVTDVRNRMSVLRLSDGGFAVFSPLAATPECVAMLLGLIQKERLKLSSAYLIAPSSYPEHHEALAVRAWRVCAHACGCRCARERVTDPTNERTNSTHCPPLNHPPTHPLRPSRRGARPSRRRAS